MRTKQAWAGWEQAIDDAGARAESELRRAVAYLNDDVVPEVRREGARALRMAAEELRHLAAHLDHLSGAGRASAADTRR